MKTTKTTKAIFAGSLVAGALFAVNGNEVKANDLFSYSDLGSAGHIRSVLLNDFNDLSMTSNAIELKCGEGKKAADGKCGEGAKAKAKDGKCGEGAKAKGKDATCGVGTHGAKAKAKDGKCGEGKKAKDGKCGEGKCGEGKKK